MTKRDSTPIRRATSIPNSATVESEAPWQQLMVFNYLVAEAIDAMEEERSIGLDMPLNESWQQFLFLLRLKKPKVSTCLDRLIQSGFFDELGGMQ